MTSNVVPIPLWLSSRRTGALLVVVGTLLVLFGIGFWLDSREVEQQAQREVDPPPPASPRESTSSPPTTSS